MKKINTKGLLTKLAAVLILIAICVVMFIIGRGHTVYLDNKSIDLPDGSKLSAYHKITVYVNGEKISKLSAKDRGMATTMGQTFKMTLEVTKEKKGEEKTIDVTLKLPYSLDGIVINLPAYLEGYGEEIYQSEFVSLATEESTEDEEVVTDEFALGDF